jgi:hypothetical protein
MEKDLERAQRKLRKLKLDEEEFERSLRDSSPESLPKSAGKRPHDKSKTKSKYVRHVS